MMWFALLRSEFLGENARVLSTRMYASMKRRGRYRYILIVTHNKIRRKHAEPG